MSACTRPHCVSIFWGSRRRQLPASSQPNLGSTSPPNCSQWWPPTLENGNALGSQNHIMFLYLSSSCPWQFLPFKIILKKVLLLYDPSQLSISPNKIRVEYAFKKTFKKKQPCATAPQTQSCSSFTTSRGAGTTVATGASGGSSARRRRVAAERRKELLALASAEQSNLGLIWIYNNLDFKPVVFHLL